MRSSHRVAAVAIAVALFVAGPAWPDEHADTEEAAGSEDPGNRAAAVGTSVFYTPTKVLFAGGGAVASGFTWLWNRDRAKEVFDCSVRGDYVVRGRHLEGRRKLEFCGKIPEAEPEPE